jgi:hypothetical protein
MNASRSLPRWPLFLIALPAAVAVWSGWVGLGQLSGFGLVEPLPGIVPWHLDTAITLPVGVEAYASFALGAWLRAGTPETARKFAKRSAIGALGLGMTGQVAYHLLAAAHAHRAPWPVVVMVACMPVVTLGFGVALAHLLRAGDLSGSRSAGTDRDVLQTASQTGLQTEGQTGTGDALQTGTATPGEPVRPPKPDRSGKRAANRSGRATNEDAEKEFAGEIAGGQVPSIYQVRTRLHVGNDRAKVLRQHIARQALST